MIRMCNFDRTHEPYGTDLRRANRYKYQYLRLQPIILWEAGAGEEDFMIWTIFVVLLALWLLGLVTSYTMGGFIHLLLLCAIVVFIIQLVQGRRRIA
jgi:hypothetical protein